MDKEETRRFGRHVVQSPMEYSLCAGCTTCEIVCTLIHDGLVSPSYNRIFVDRGTRSMIHTILSCQQCSDHPCYSACPKKDEAMCIDENGIVYVNEEKCIGCGLCAKACVFEPSRINMVKSSDKNTRKAKKCDMCRNDPEGPACVRWCPVKCLAVTGGTLPWEEDKKDE